MLFRSQGVQPDVATYNVLLQACDRAAKHTEMVGLVQSMPKLGVEPNVVNYNTAIRALGRNGDVAGVRTLMDKMRDRDLYVNSPSHVVQALYGESSGWPCVDCVFEHGPDQPCTKTFKFSKKYDSVYEGWQG